MSELIYTDESLDQNLTIQEETEENNLQLDSYPIEFKEVALKDFEDSDSIQQIENGIEKLLSKSQQKEAALLKSSQVLINDGDYERAQKLIKEVIKLNPASTDAFKLNGQCYLGLGNTQKAVECFQENVQRLNDFQSLALLAEAYYVSGSDQQALDFYFQALENLDPTSFLLFDIYKNIGNIFVRIKEFDAAEEFYNRAYKIDAHSDILLVNYGTLEVQKSNWQEAINRFRNAVKINIENDKAWVGLAISHREFGDHELSRGNLLKALDVNPLNEVALQLMFDWSNKDGNYDELFSWVEGVTEKYPELTSLRFYQAQVLFHVERYQHAFYALASLIDEYPDYQAARELQSKVITILGDC